jgi:ketosteroid isomerase-like protein
MGTPELNPSNPSTEIGPTLSITPDHKVARTETVTADEDMVEVGETRAATVDAGGPYGTQASPLYEGNPVNFVAQISGDINDNYMFRWDLDNDGNFEGPGSAPDFFGAYGDNDMIHQFNDNNIGLAKVEAWDGVSYTTFSGGGNLWNEDYPPYWYMGGYYYGTVGYKFDVTQTITIDELGACRYYYPYQYYNIRLWTSGGSLLRQVSYPYIPYYSWRWFSISPITIPAGEYVLSVGIRGYYQCGHDNPGPSADGIIDPIEWVRASGQYSFPTQSMSTQIIPYIDMEYTYSYLVPDVLEDTAEVFIDNVAPIAINPMALSSGPFYEGADIGFTGWLYDPGTDDDWWYRWSWGDGTYSDWKQVIKYSGGMRVLWLHTYSGQIGTIMSDFETELGDAIVRHEEYDCGPLGNNDAPDLDYLEEFDVVIVGSNYIPGPGVGNVLADYCEGGGGVVELVAMWHPTFGIGGRWRSDGYTVYPQGSSVTGYSSTTILDGSHPIIDGQAGTVGNWGCSLAIYSTSIMSGATLLAQTGSVRTAAYRDENNVGPGSGRVVGLDIFAQPGYYSGDANKVIANAAFWASQATPPAPLPMPIQLEPEYHQYVDDHPTHVTPMDTFDVELQIRDDDHLKSVMVGSPVNLDFEDFEGHGYSYPPGWYETGIGGWMMHYAYQLDGMCPYIPYYYYGVSILYSPVYNFAGLGGAILDWDNYWEANWPTGYQDGYVQVSIDGGATWTTLEEFHHLDPSSEVAHYSVSYAAAANEPWVQFRFWIDMYDDWYWEIDNFDLWAASMYTMYGLGSASTTVDVSNAPPVAIVPPELYGKVVDEVVNIDFEGIEIFDMAMDELTEEYWYKFDFDDGTETPWIYKGTLGKPSFNILLATTWSGIQGTVQSALAAELSDFEPTIDIYNWYTAGSPPDLSLMQQYDVVLVGTNYIPSSSLANAMGDRLYEYCQAGGNVVQMWSSFHTSARITGDWTGNNYNAIVRGSLHFGTEAMDTVYDWGHPIMEDVTAMDAYYKHNSYDANVNAIRLADYSSGKVLAAYTNYNAHPAGNGRIAGLAFFPSSGNYGGDAITMMANALKWGAGVTDLNDPVLDTIPHVFGDNGVYYVDLMIIDDDMDWTWTWGSGGTLVPGPDATISHNVIPIEVLNVDPVIRPINAWAYLDLVIRTTGEPKNDCTMTLWDGGTAVGSVTVHHDGNYKMETMPAVFDMLRINDYSVTVEYENADPDGANPTWIFEGRFSSGHTKELKKVFKEDGTTWTIGPDLLKPMFRGEDIVFTAGADDDGSDDLAFVWNFGDCSPHGVHIYANVDQGTAVEGASDEATVIFDQLAVRDPWFDYMPNTIRSPDMNPISVRDMITHAFDEDQPYYFYVTLTVIDDDVKDGYPSPYLNGGGYDMEFCEIDLS